MFRLVLALLLISSTADAGMIIRGSGGGATLPDSEATWNFDNGAITTDSSGNSNTLTNTNTVTNSTTLFVQGDASALKNATNQQLTRADADLSADFWGKSGSTGLDGTACAAFRPTSVAADETIIGKYHTGDNARSWRMIIDSTTTSVEFWIGNGTGDSGVSNISEDGNEHTTNIAVDHWYAACVALDSAGRDYTIRLYDCGTDNQPASCSHTGTDVTGNFASAMSIDSAVLSITCNGDGSVDYAGYLDAISVWNVELTTGEMDLWAATLGI